MIQQLKMPDRAFRALMFAVSFATGCGGSGIADNPDQVCVPGSQVMCACPGGGKGVQVCREDGATLGICMACPMPATGGAGDEAGGESGGRAGRTGTPIPAGAGGLTCEGARDCEGTVSAGGAGG